MPVQLFEGTELLELRDERHDAIRASAQAFQQNDGVRKIRKVRRPRQLQKAADVASDDRSAHAGATNLFVSEIQQLTLPLEECAVEMPFVADLFIA